jgi:hypothetical protein
VLVTISHFRSSLILSSKARDECFKTKHAGNSQDVGSTVVEHSARNLMILGPNPTTSAGRENRRKSL